MIDLQFWPSNWHLWSSVTSEQYSSAMYGFPVPKILWKDTHKSNTVDLNIWPPIDLHFWLPNGKLWPPVTYEQYSIARYEFSDTKNLWKNTHKSNTVLNVWPPDDLQFWPPNGSWDLKWHLIGILVPDMDYQIPKTYEKTPISPIQYILMIDLQLTSNYDLQMAVMSQGLI